MKHILLCLAVCTLVACSSETAPTPLPLQQYPATWTPEPTPTNTPPGPTPTLVIQNTRGPLPTRDPNRRVLPTVPSGSAGTWVDLTNTTLTENSNALERAQIIVATEIGTTPRRTEQFLFLETTTIPPADTLASGVNGIVLKENAFASAAQIAALRENIKPRVVLARTFISDTNTIEQLAPNVDGLRLDNFLRAAETPLDFFSDEMTWKKQIDTLSKFSANPNTLLLTGPGMPVKVQEEQAGLGQQWVMYAFTSFLLGVNNTHTFFGAPPLPYANLPTLEKLLGAPLGSYAKLNGVYQRRFANGLVLVNPSNDTRAFFLPRAYVNSSGAPVPQIEMVPHTGEILYNAPQ